MINSKLKTYSCPREDKSGCGGGSGQVGRIMGAQGGEIKFAHRTHPAILANIPLVGPDASSGGQDQPIPGHGRQHLAHSYDSGSLWPKLARDRPAAWASSASEQTNGHTNIDQICMQRISIRNKQACEQLNGIDPIGNGTIGFIAGVRAASYWHQEPYERGANGTTSANCATSAVETFGRQSNQSGPQVGMVDQIIGGQNQEARENQWENNKQSSGAQIGPAHDHSYADGQLGDGASFSRPADNGNLAQPGTGSGPGEKDVIRIENLAVQLDLLVEEFFADENDKINLSYYLNQFETNQCDLSELLANLLENLLNKLPNPMIKYKLLHYIRLLYVEPRRLDEQADGRRRENVASFPAYDDNDELDPRGQHETNMGEPISLADTNRVGNLNFAYSVGADDHVMDADDVDGSRLVATPESKNQLDLRLFDAMTRRYLVASNVLIYNSLLAAQNTRPRASMAEQQKRRRQRRAAELQLKQQKTQASATAISQRFPATPNGAGETKSSLGPLSSLAGVGAKPTNWRNLSGTDDSICGPMMVMDFGCMGRGEIRSDGSGWRWRGGPSQSSASCICLGRRLEPELSSGSSNNNSPLFAGCTRQHSESVLADEANENNNIEEATICHLEPGSPIRIRRRDSSIRQRGWSIGPTSSHSFIERQLEQQQQPNNNNNNNGNRSRGDNNNSDHRPQLQLKLEQPIDGRQSGQRRAENYTRTDAADTKRRPETPARSPSLGATIMDSQQPVVEGHCGPPTPSAGRQQQQQHQDASQCFDQPQQQSPYQLRPHLAHLAGTSADCNGCGTAQHFRLLSAASLDSLNWLNLSAQATQNPWPQPTASQLTNNAQEASSTHFRADSHQQPSALTNLTQSAGSSFYQQQQPQSGRQSRLTSDRDHFYHQTALQQMLATDQSLSTGANWSRMDPLVVAAGWFDQQQPAAMLAGGSLQCSLAQLGSIPRQDHRELALEEQPGVGLVELAEANRAAYLAAGAWEDLPVRGLEPAPQQQWPAAVATKLHGFRQVAATRCAANELDLQPMQPPTLTTGNHRQSSAATWLGDHPSHYKYNPTTIRASTTGATHNEAGCDIYHQYRTPGLGLVSSLFQQQRRPWQQDNNFYNQQVTNNNNNNTSGGGTAFGGLDSMGEQFTYNSGIANDDTIGLPQVTIDGNPSFMGGQQLEPVHHRHPITTSAATARRQSANGQHAALNMMTSDSRTATTIRAQVDGDNQVEAAAAAGLSCAVPNQQLISPSPLASQTMSLLDSELQTTGASVPSTTIDYYHHHRSNPDYGHQHSFIQHQEQFGRSSLGGCRRSITPNYTNYSAGCVENRCCSSMSVLREAPEMAGRPYREFPHGACNECPDFRNNNNNWHQQQAAAATENNWPPTGHHGLIQRAGQPGLVYNKTNYKNRLEPMYLHQQARPRSHIAQSRTSSLPTSPLAHDKFMPPSADALWPTNVQENDDGPHSGHCLAKATSAGHRSRQRHGRHHLASAAAANNNSSHLPSPNHNHHTSGQQQPIQLKDYRQQQQPLNRYNSGDESDDAGLMLVPSQARGRLPMSVAEQMKQQANTFVNSYGSSDKQQQAKHHRSSSSSRSQKPNLQVRRTLKVKIKKSKPILGIAIEGGFNVSGQLLPRIVCVHEDGAAYQCGKLRASDLILEVNGKSTINMTHDEIAKTIATAYYQGPKSYIEFLIGESIHV